MSRLDFAPPITEMTVDLEKGTLEFTARAGTHIDQEKLIDELVEKVGLKDCKPTNTPPAELHLLRRNSGSVDEVLAKKYQRIIGTLNYVVSISRPDIAYYVHKLAGFSSNPSEEHFGHLMQLVRFVKTTKERKLFYGCGELAVKAFADADWASDVEDRISISGHAVYLNECSGPVIWMSKKQGLVALSSCEAEYIALADCCKSLLFLQSLLEELDLAVKHRYVVFQDNQSTPFSC